MNPFKRGTYQKLIETAEVDYQYQRELEVPSEEIERVVAKINDTGWMTTLYKCVGQTKQRNVPGGQALPDWLHYNHNSNILSGTPKACDTGTVTIQVLGAAGIIKEQFDLTVGQNPIAGDNLEMQPWNAHDQSGAPPDHSPPFAPYYNT